MGITSCCVWKGWEWRIASENSAFIPRLRMMSGLCFSLDHLQGAKCGVRRQGAPTCPAQGSEQDLGVTLASPPSRVGTSSGLDKRWSLCQPPPFPLDSSTQSLPCARLPACPLC